MNEQYDPFADLDPIQKSNEVRSNSYMNNINQSSNKKLQYNNNKNISQTQQPNYIHQPQQFYDHYQQQKSMPYPPLYNNQQLLTASQVVAPAPIQPFPLSQAPVSTPKQTNAQMPVQPSTAGLKPGLLTSTSSNALNKYNNNPFETQNIPSLPLNHIPLINKKNSNIDEIFGVPSSEVTSTTVTDFDPFNPTFDMNQNNDTIINDDKEFQNGNNDNEFEADFSNIQWDDDNDNCSDKESIASSQFDDSNLENIDDESDSVTEWSPCEEAEKLRPLDTSRLEYEATFDFGTKLGILMERIDIEKNTRKKEVARVKMVVENAEADRKGVSNGSIIIGINNRSVKNDNYNKIMDLIKSTPRPITIRFKKGTADEDKSIGHCLTRISSGTFSVGNLTSGNAKWKPKFFAFTGRHKTTLQLFLSRAAYHECVIAAYEKRNVHTEILSFQINHEHKLTKLKTKIYKGYGNLHYFSLNVPSLHFVAAKFASDDYDTIRNLWAYCYQAIEYNKRNNLYY